MTDTALQSKKGAFLAAYRECGSIKGAAEACEVSRQRHYAWLKEAEYAEDFIHARDDAIDELEEVARARAKKGSDLLLIFLLKHLRPEVYQDRIEHTGPGGGPMTIEHLAPQARQPDE